jgi:hypothetical protein
MPKKNIHTVPDSQTGKWHNKREGQDKPLSSHNSQTNAIDAGRKQAEKDGVELVINRPDGRIRDKDSYGNDPCPPKDKKH